MRRPTGSGVAGGDGPDAPEPDEAVDVAIVGAGFGGLGMAARLRREGTRSFVVIDGGDGIGGTWRDNTYPGAACDVPSTLYSFSFFPSTWPRRFSGQRDILAYLERLVDEHGLGPFLRMGARVERMDFDEGSARWHLRLDDRRLVSARAVVSAVGQLNRPAVPDIEGVERFAGPSWHSARWDHSVDLAGKRVAVVGTGASAVQFVPEVAKVAARTVVFQRSAPYVLPKMDRPYSRLERAVHERVRAVQLADRLRVYLTGETLGLGIVRSRRLLAALTALWRRSMHAQVADPQLRLACEPDYVMGCKRVLFSNDWYRTLARPDVDLVTDPVAEVTATGVRTVSGREEQVDAIIFGTGFATSDVLAPVEVTGLGGRSLREEWSDGASAHLGVTVSGYPNLFLLYGPNTNLGSNSIVFMLEAQIGYVLGALQALDRERLAWVDVRADVQRRFAAWVDATSRRTAWTSGCHSWYTTTDGRNTNNWPSFTFVYRWRLRRFDLLDHTVMPLRASPLATAAPPPASATWATAAGSR